MGMNDINIESDVDLDNIDEELAAKAGQRFQAPGDDETSPDQDDIDVQITDDTPEADRGRPKLAESPEPTEEELAQYSEKVKSRIGKLQHAWHDERREKEALQRERDEALSYAQAALARVQQAEALAQQAGTTANTSQKKEVEVALAAAKAKLKEATEAFDADAMVEAQTELAQLTWRKAQLDNTPAETKVTAPNPQQTQQPAAHSRQPVAPGPDKRAQAWAEQNKAWFMKDHEMTAFAHGVHQNLVDKLIDPRLEPELYYKSIDDAVRKRFPERFKSEPTAPRKPASAVAPVVRTTGNKTVVTLTETQKRLCQRLGVSPQEYAREMLRLRKGEQE